MLTLATGNTIQGVTTGASTAITYTIFGDALGVSDSFQVLAQGQLPTSAAPLYTVPGSTSALVKSMVFVNTTGAGVLMTIYVNGSTAANSIGSMTIPANGLAMWTPAEGWCTRDSNGSVVQSFVTPIILTGDVTGSGSSPIATTLATFGPGVGTFGSASSVPVITTDVKGRISAVTPTSIQITEAQVTNLTTDLAGKQATGNYITALTGNVVATGPGSVSATIQPGVVTNAMRANSPANSLKGEFTGSASAEQDLSVAVSQFVARASTGNLAAKPITDPALTLVGTTTLGSVSAFFPKEINGVAYITAGNPQGWAGADLGAWCNAAWSYLITQYPQIGGEIRIGPGIFTATTPMILGTQFAAISLTGTAAGFGGPSGATLGAVGGTIINYTPTTGICLTIGGTNNNGGGIKISDIAFQGTGIGNGATAVQVGIQSGATGANAFASQAGGHWTNVTINGFTNGVTWNTASHVAYAQHFYNCHIQYCTNGMTPFGEANVMFGGLIGNCVTGILGNLNGSDFNAIGTAFDDNTTTAINVSQPLFRMTLDACRFENAGGGTDTYITQSDGSIIIKGGSMQSDIVAVSTSTGFCQITGGLFNLDGTWLYNSSANRTFTQLFNVSSGCKSFVADPNISPSSAAGFGALTNVTAGAFPKRFLANALTNTAVITLPLTTVTNLDSRGGLALPANVRPGTHLRCTVWMTNTATIETLTTSIRFGTTNTSADTQLSSQAWGAGTAVAGVGKLVVEFILPSATVAYATQIMQASAGFSSSTFAGSIPVIPAAVATTSPTFVGIYGSSTVANIVSVKSVTWEIISQGN